MSVYDEVKAERERQDARFGPQDHPSYQGNGTDRQDAQWARDVYEFARSAGRLTWREILDEEVAEVYASADDAERRRELIQVAAVAIAEVEAIDRRGAK